MKPFLYLYLLMLGLKDWKDQYISWYWILPSSILLMFYFPTVDKEHVFGACLFGLPGLFMYQWKKHWLGSADVCYFFFFGFLMGYQRFMVAMLIALPLGLLWSIKTEEVPFITCLCIGVCIAMEAGYTIWYHCIL